MSIYIAHLLLIAAETRNLQLARGGEKKIKHARRTSASALKTVPTYLPFFSNFFYCGFGCFSAWGTQKQRKNFFGNFLVMAQKATS